MTTGLGGGANPFGNRGPDLIETIRLEKVVGNPYLASAGCEGIALPHATVQLGEVIPGHPRSTKATAMRRPRTGAHCGRLWQEPMWNAPSWGGALKVQDVSAAQDVGRPAPAVPPQPTPPPETKHFSHTASAAGSAAGSRAGSRPRSPMDSPSRLSARLGAISPGGMSAVPDLARPASLTPSPTLSVSLTLTLSLSPGLSLPLPPTRRGRPRASPRSRPRGTRRRCWCGRRS